MRYRRALIPGGTYFFTVNLASRRETLLVDHVDVLREAVRGVRRAHPFEIVAWVVLPEHMHAIWTLPPDDPDYSMRWNRIKGEFSRRLPRCDPGLTPSRVNKRERGIWQRRFWEHLIRDEDRFARHVDYIHFNPVKHGHANKAADWPYSSFRRFVQQGLLHEDWGDGGDPDGNYGEPAR
ncbi:REP-associated tyrosine transposase [Acidihalobacter prosperus]|uniref:Transposase n=1 Tax=Acidihalobacter prosperus TaxID=160660 RepID=A0A1A6C785_9GAMM|nr:transposase [Acidihalobacter prosperus]OBS10426.1 transposase [Acidihalobacter prosperus]